MSALVENIIDKYNYVFYDLADPRTQDWPAVSSPLLIFSIILVYLYFSKSLGPRLMIHKKPFELMNALLIYNSFQVLLNVYFVIRGSLHVFSEDYNLACQEINYSNTPKALHLSADVWWYFFAKITELLDTVFFVLRKKYNQVTFLHLYHHSIMLLITWIGVKYFAGGGQFYLMGYLNSIVHVIMYSYYLIAGMGPEYQKYIWWKKHVTTIQLIQFCIVFVHNASIFFYECNFPKMISFLTCINALIFMYMFGKFYIKSYKKDSTASSKHKLEANDINITMRKINRYDVPKTGKGKTR